MAKQPLRIKLKLREHSWNQFLADNKIHAPYVFQTTGTIIVSSSSGGYLAPKSIFSREDFYIKKSLGLKTGECIQLEFSDTAQHSQTKLNTTFVFQAEEYDDISTKMALAFSTTEEAQ